MENIVLKLHYKVHFVQILVEDTDRTLLIDVYNEMFDEVEAENIEWPLNPSLTYSYNSRSVLVREDCDLMEMFNRLGSKKTIDIWVGADDEPCHVLVMARQVRSYNAKKNVEVVEVSEEQNKQGKRREKIPFRTSVSKPPPTSALIPVVEAPDLETIEDVEPLCIEPSNTALISPRRSSRLNKSQVTEPSQPTSPVHVFEPDMLCDQATEPDMNVVASSSVIMSPRRSVRLNKNQLSQSSLPSETDMNVGASSADVEPNQPDPHLSSSIRRTSPRFRPSTHVQATNSKISKFKLPRTTTLKRGLYVPNHRSTSIVNEEGNTRVARRCRSAGLNLSQPFDTHDDESDGSYVPSSEEDTDEEHELSDLDIEDTAIISTLEFIDDDYNPYEDHGWMDG